MSSTLLFRVQRWTSRRKDRSENRSQKDRYLFCGFPARDRPWHHWQHWNWWPSLWRWTSLCRRRWSHSSHWPIPMPINRYPSFIHYLTKVGGGFPGQCRSPDSSPGLPQGVHFCVSKQSFDVLLEPKEWDHAVELIPGSTPSGCKVYPLSPVEKKELDIFLKENLETGCIWPSTSPISSLVFFIKKKNGSLRLVQDYWALNVVTVKNKYPLPLISKLINKLQGVKYFTKLDIHWGFNNVQMKVRDEWKAAFQTNRGLYEPLVMFFGLMNSPATFQTMMDSIFKELISKGVVVVYLDDILIFTKTLDKHWKVVWWEKSSCF